MSFIRVLLFRQLLLVPLGVPSARQRSVYSVSVRQLPSELSVNGNGPSMVRQWSVNGPSMVRQNERR